MDRSITKLLHRTSQLRLVAYNQHMLVHCTKRKGSTHRSRSDPAEDVIKRAEYYLNNPDDWENYNLLFNNCESFTVYCKTKEKISRQVVGRDDSMYPQLFSGT